MAQREPGDDRKKHVERFFGDPEDGNEDCWVDIELIDRMVVKGFHGKTYTKTFHYFQLNTNKMAGREYTEVQVKNPEDEDQFVTIKAYDEYKQKGFGNFEPPPPSNVNFKTKRRHDNKKENERRGVDVYKIIHKEIDDVYLDTGGQPPPKPDAYLDAIRWTNEEDDSQYVYVEIVNAYTMQRSAGPRYQRTTFKLHQENSELVSLSEKFFEGQDDPTRIDPLQNIINVSWGGLAVEFGDKASGPPKDKAKK